MQSKIYIFEEPNNILSEIAELKSKNKKGKNDQAIKDLEEKHKSFRHEFTLSKNNLLLKKKSNRLLKRFAKLIQEFTSDIDLTPVKKYESDIHDLKVQVFQLESMATRTKDDDEYLEARKKDLEELNDKFESDAKVQSLVKENSFCEGLAIKELLDDTEFLIPWLSEVLTGDFDKINFEDENINEFTTPILTDFFLLYRKNNQKLIG